MRETLRERKKGEEISLDAAVLEDGSAGEKLIGPPSLPGFPFSRYAVFVFLLLLFLIPALVFEIGLRSASRLGERSQRMENGVRSGSGGIPDAERVIARGFAREFPECEDYPDGGDSKSGVSGFADRERLCVHIPGFKAIQVPVEPQIASGSIAVIGEKSGSVIGWSPRNGAVVFSTTGTDKKRSAAVIATGVHISDRHGAISYLPGKLFTGDDSNLLSRFTRYFADFKAGGEGRVSPVGQVLDVSVVAPPPTDLKQSSVAVRFDERGVTSRPGRDRNRSGGCISVLVVSKTADGRTKTQGGDWIVATAMELEPAVHRQPGKRPKERDPMSARSLSRASVRLEDHYDGQYTGRICLHVPYGTTVYVRLVMHHTSGHGQSLNDYANPVGEKNISYDGSSRVLEAVRHLPKGKRPLDEPTWSVGLGSLEPCGGSLSDLGGGPGPISNGAVGRWLSLARLAAERSSAHLASGWETDAVARDRSVADETGRDAFESGTTQNPSLVWVPNLCRIPYPTERGSVSRFLRSRVTVILGGNIFGFGNDTVTTVTRSDNGGFRSDGPLSVDQSGPYIYNNSNSNSDNVGNTKAIEDAADWARAEVIVIEVDPGVACAMGTAVFGAWISAAMGGIDSAIAGGKWERVENDHSNDYAGIGDGDDYDDSAVGKGKNTIAKKVVVLSPAVRLDTASLHSAIEPPQCVTDQVVAMANAAAVLAVKSRESSRVSGWEILDLSSATLSAPPPFYATDGRGMSPAGRLFAARALVAHLLARENV